MKWGDNSGKASKLIKKTIGRVVGNRGISMLLMVAALGLLAGASHTWAMTLAAIGVAILASHTWA